MPAQVTTLHVWQTYGPTRLLVLENGGRERSDRVFSQGSADPYLSLQLDGVGHFSGPAVHVMVSEPDGTGGGGMFIRFNATRASRGISILLKQPEPWPPRPSFDLVFSRENQNSISDVVDRQPGGVARSGRLELAVSEGKLTGSFEAEMVQEGRMWSLRGSLSGEWSFYCQTLDTSRTTAGQPRWSLDSTLTSSFCAGVARQAGITRPGP
jgi:hypothetical protein